MPEISQFFGIIITTTMMSITRHTSMLGTDAIRRSLRSPRCES